jgi:hypothetical protein
VDNAYLNSVDVYWVLQIANQEEGNKKSSLTTPMHPTAERLSVGFQDDQRRVISNVTFSLAVMSGSPHHLL